MRKAWLILGIITLANSGWAAPATGAGAKEVRLRETPLDIKEGDRLVVSGIRAQVRLQSSAGNLSVLKARKVLRDSSQAEAQARFEALNILVRRDGNTVYIETKGPSTATELGDWLKPGAPEAILEIESFAVPTEISVRDGGVTAQGWKQPLSVSLVEGNVKTSATDGTLRLQVQKGDVKVDSHRGRIELDSFGAKVSVQNLEGDLLLANFAGDSVLREIKGNVDLRAQGGAVTLAKSTGALEFEVGRGSLSVQDFDGSIRGQTELGSVSAAVVGESDIHIESNQGSVSLALPADSGSTVRLQTEEGTLTAPASIRPSTAGAVKLASGRLVGSGAKGTVSIKSRSGSIRLR